MEKIAILVDSAADIEPSLAESKGIYTLPLYVNLHDEFYKDRVELSPEAFYQWMRENDTMPKTSTASPGDAIEIFQQIKDDGYDKVLVVCINKEFSSTYNLFQMTHVEGLESYVFDTGSLTMAEGLFAIYARDLIDEGKTFEEIIEILEAKKTASKVYFSIDSFKYIVEGGRLPRSLGKVGDALSVKPILTINPIEGAFKIAKLARGENRVIREFKKFAEKELADVSEYFFFIGHGGYEAGMNILEETFADIIKGAKDFYKVQISPTLGANTGPGLFGFGIFAIE